MPLAKTYTLLLTRETCPLSSEIFARKWSSVHWLLRPPLVPLLIYLVDRRILIISLLALRSIASPIPGFQGVGGKLTLLYWSCIWAEACQAVTNRGWYTSDGVFHKGARLSTDYEGVGHFPAYTDWGPRRPVVWWEREIVATVIIHGNEENDVDIDAL